MSEEKQCPQCQKTLPANAPDGLCPECLLQMAMSSGTATDIPSSILNDSFDATKLAADTPQSLDITVSRGGSTPSSNRDYPSGTEIGSFTLDRKLGEGGMGAVYEAYDAKTERRVALKILKHTLNTPEARKRFLREGRTAASINHPNSVYVYGTENLDGKLVISMELVGHSNLQDLVRRDGPMTYRQAVDAILQVIDGLEAAASVGVLHRDVKPSNCFVDGDGDIKVGDFGLSISTQAMEDSLITGNRTLLGTPAFSSPEQLRGDDLDSRSDIYSVGVTLFYLLSGEVPFAANNLVQLLSVVLEQDPPSVCDYESRIPRALSNVIQKCLAKTPEARWKDYGQLREALQPFTSEAPHPGSLSKRFASYLVDCIPLSAVGMTVGLTLNFFDVQGSMRLLAVCVSYAAYILYYGLLESTRGQSLGKMLVGLSVVDRERSIPTLKQALLRSAIFNIMPSLVATPVGLFLPPSMLTAPIAVVIAASNPVLCALMFSTVRSSNGLAGLHGLLSGTRVVEKRGIARKRTESLPVNEKPNIHDDAAETIGPYHVLKQLNESNNTTTTLAYDMQLLRRVWIRQGPVTPELSTARRQVNRIGRLRWLNGFRNGKSGWDAFEAVNGRPLAQIVRQRQKWSDVRTWLLDLATELHATEKDGSLPKLLSVQNLWVTPEGRLKLLDFPAPDMQRNVAGDKPGFDVFDTQTADFRFRFLQHVAQVALKTYERPKSSESVLPLHATDFLAKLNSSETGADVGLPELQTDLQKLVRLPTQVSRVKKWLMLLAALVLPLMFFLMGLGMKTLMSWSYEQNPVIELNMELGKPIWYANHFEDPSEVEQLEVFIADYFGDFVRDKQRWEDPAVVRYFNRPTRANLRNLIERVVKDHEAASDSARQAARDVWMEQLRKKKPVSEMSANQVAFELEDLAQQLQAENEFRLAKIYVADKFGFLVRDKSKWDSLAVVMGLQPVEKRRQIEEIVAQFSDASAEEIQQARLAHSEGLNFDDNPVFGSPTFALSMAAFVYVLVLGIPAILAGLIFRGGLLMELFQVVAVRRSGKRAYRLQTFWRAILWTLPGVGLGVGASILPFASAGGFDSDKPAMVAVSLIFFSVLIPIASMILMKRGLLDRLAGTYIVPR